MSYPPKLSFIHIIVKVIHIIMKFALTILEQTNKYAS